MKIKNKILTLIGMIGLSYFAGCVKCDQQIIDFQNKEAIIFTNYTGKYTKINWNNYSGIDYWNIDGKGTFDEVCEWDNNKKTKIYNWHEKNTPEFKKISSKLDNILKNH